MAKWPYCTTRWKKLRDAILQETPLCVLCGHLGRVVPATDVDHILPVKNGGEPFDRANLQPLCHSCHSRKTATEDGAFGNYGECKPIGCDVSGWPTDPRHPWNNGGAE